MQALEETKISLADCLACRYVLVFFLVLVLVFFVGGLFLSFFFLLMGLVDVLQLLKLYWLSLKVLMSL